MFRVVGVYDHSEKTKVVADFRDVRVIDGAVYIGDKLTDMVELALFLNKVEKADKIVITQKGMEEFLDTFPAAFDKKEIEIIDD